jgi:hypothetical protein
VSEFEQDAKRWREFCRLASFQREGFNSRDEEGFTIRVKVPLDWDLSFVQAIDASIRAQIVKRILNETVVVGTDRAATRPSDEDAAAGT